MNVSTKATGAPPAHGAAPLLGSVTDQHDVIDQWAWQLYRDEQAEAPAATRARSRRQLRIVWAMRLVALVVVSAGMVAISRVATRYGLGLGILGVWLLPMVVLGVVLAVEKVLVRVTR